MDLDGLRSLVRDLNFQAHGVPATVDGVATRIIWVSPATNAVPTGGDFRRSEAKRTVAIRRDEVPAVPLGSLIVTGLDQVVPDSWRVDAMDDVQPGYHQVIVAPAV